MWLQQDSCKPTPDGIKDGIKKSQAGEKKKKNVRPLSVKEIAAITRVGTTAVGGVPGLSVQVLQSGDRYFVYRYQIDGRRSMVSLGSLSEISLRVAR